MLKENAPTFLDRAPLFPGIPMGKYSYDKENKIDRLPDKN